MPTKIQIVEQGICPDTFNDKDLPTDVHIITYTENGERKFDAVRAYTKVDIFDEYYDKLGKDNPIHSIQSATGELNQNYMAKSKRMTKSDYIEQLCDITRHHAKRLKVNQIKELITKHGKLND